MPTDALRAEVAARRSAFEERLRAQGLSAAIIATEANFQYLTGYRSPSWAMRARPMFLVIRPGQPAIAVVNDAESQRIASDVAALEPLSYLDPEPSRADGETLLDFGPPAERLLRSVLATDRRVGAELGTQMTPALSLPVLERLRDGGLELADISPALWSLRRTKGRTEIAAIRESARALDEAYERFARHAAIGATERDLAGLFRQAVGRTHADALDYLVVIADLHGSTLGPPGDRAWKRGELLLIDAGLTVDGYWCDFARVYAGGEATAAQAHAYEDLVVALDTAREMVRPGAAAANVSRALARRSRSASSFGRNGHGIGLDLTEPPSLSPADPAVLEAGMVLCLEPNALAPGVGRVMAEEMVVVTEDGCELLSSRFPETLPVVP